MRSTPAVAGRPPFGEALSEKLLRAAQHRLADRVHLDRASRVRLLPTVGVAIDTGSRDRLRRGTLVALPRVARIVLLYTLRLGQLVRRGEGQLVFGGDLEVLDERVIREGGLGLGRSILLWLVLVRLLRVRLALDVLHAARGDVDRDQCASRQLGARSGLLRDHLADRPTGMIEGALKRRSQPCPADRLRGIPGRLPDMLSDPQPAARRRRHRRAGGLRIGCALLVHVGY